MGVLGARDPENRVPQCDSLHFGSRLLKIRVVAPLGGITPREKKVAKHRTETQVKITKIQFPATKM